MKRYLPILKSKQGELDALSELPNQIRDAITPLIEIVPIPSKWMDGEDEPVSSKSIDEHVAQQATKIKEAWQSQSPLLLDGYYIEGEDQLASGEEPILKLLKSLSGLQISTIPVLGLSRYVEYNDACLQFSREINSDICLRLSPEDLNQPKSFRARIEAFLTYTGIPATKTHLILDYQTISSELSGALKASLPYVIDGLPHLQDWSTLTFAAGSFPSDLGMKNHSIETFERVEWDIWKSLNSADGQLDRSPDYADYAISNPELVNLDPRIIRMSPKIKYCSELEWVVVRGEAFRRKKERKQSMPSGDQYKQLSQMLVDHPAWRGKAFSSGDEHIQGCADASIVKCGNAQKWVTVGTVHHLVFAARQLASHLSP